MNRKGDCCTTQDNEKLFSTKKWAIKPRGDTYDILNHTANENKSIWKGYISVWFQLHDIMEKEKRQKD